MSVVVYSDAELEKRIANAQADLRAWAVSHDSWYESGFTTYASGSMVSPAKMR